MAVYPDSVKMYAELNSVWTEITSDVLGEDKITGFWGMRSNREFDRVADVGRMNFTLDNSAGLYAPSLGTALSGWGKGTPVKLVVHYQERDYIKFYGTVDTLKITGGALGLRRVYVSVRDWLDFAAKYPLVNPGYQTNKRMDEALETIVGGMPIQPQGTNFDTGIETFPTIFDSVTTKTRGASEFNKLALSEMGYIYERKDYDTGGTLTAESRTRRRGTTTPTTYSVPITSNGFVLKEDGDDLLLESGDKIIIESATSLALDVDNNMQGVEVVYGDHLVNRVSVIAYPRRVDTSLTVLFSLGHSMQIGAGEIIEFRAGYFDPEGGAIVNAISGTMVAPVITTDYLMNTESDGSGSNITSDLSITATYGSEGVTYLLENNNEATGYITLLQARGYGVYTYANLESSVENQESIDAYGYHSETLHQMYQQNTSLGKTESSKMLDDSRLPRTVLNSVSLQGNKSADLLFGFLMYDVGDLVPITEDISGIDANYYIQAVNFAITPAADASGVIDYGWIVKEQNGVSSGNYSFVAAEFSVGVPSTKVNRIDFGVLNYINSLTSKSISFWFYKTSSGKVFTCGSAADDQNWSTQINANLLQFFEFGGVWSYDGGFTNNAWFHVVITKVSTVVGTAPIVYVNGVNKALASIPVVQTVLYPQDGYVLSLGATKAGATKSGLVGKVKDLRIISGILSASDALGIYNEGAGGTGYLQNVLFQAPVVKTSELSYFTDHTMLSTDRVLDNVFGVTGKPEKDAAWTYPIIRLP